MTTTDQVVAEVMSDIARRVPGLTNVTFGAAFSRELLRRLEDEHGLTLTESDQPSGRQASSYAPTTQQVDAMRQARDRRAQR